MISLTEEARKELEAYFEGKEKTPIRVYLAPGGCSGPRLALALDEPGEDDETSEDNGLTLCINKELVEKVGAVTVGMTHMGFVVESEIPLPSGGNGGGCSSCCGGCGSSGGCPLGLNRGTVLKGPPVPILPRGEPSGGVPVAQKAIP